MSNTYTGASTAKIAQAEPAPLVTTDSPAHANVTIVAVVPSDQQHSLGPPWQEVMSHVADRLAWEDPDFKVHVFTPAALADSDTQSGYKQVVQSAQILLILDVHNPETLDLLLSSMHTVPTAIALDSHPQLEAATSLNNVTFTKPWEKAAAAMLPWSNSAKGSRVLRSVRDVYQRQTSDDLLFMLLVLIDAYITEV